MATPRAEGHERGGPISRTEAGTRSRAHRRLCVQSYVTSHDEIRPFSAKHSAEEALRGSGLAHAIVRPTAFAELWRELVATTPIVGSGRNAVNLVSVKDVAELVVDVALNGKRGEFDVGGREDVCLNELAQRAGVKPKHVPRAVARTAGLVLRPFKPGLARLMRMAAWMDTADLTYEPARPRQSRRT